MDNSRTLREYWLSWREGFSNPHTKRVVSTLETEKWRSLREIFGDPDLGMPSSGNPEADEEYERGVSMMQGGDSFGAEDAFWRADDLGHPGAARELYELAEKRGVDPSSGAYLELLGRARERGDGRAAARIGYLRKGRPDGLDQLRFADDAGDPEGSRELGLRLLDGGSLDEAEAAFRRSDRRGSASGSLALGIFLRDERNDADGAEAAFRRAGERGHPKGPLNLIDLYSDRGDAAAADAARERTLELIEKVKPLFPELREARYLEHLRNDRGRAAATGGTATTAAATGGGCVMLTVLPLIACLATAAAVPRSISIIRHHTAWKRRRM